jgi:hypothetical protein
MTDRRTSQLKSRRVSHAIMRRCGIIRQENESSSEGPRDSPSAQKAVKAQTARRA